MSFTKVIKHILIKFVRLGLNIKVKNVDFERFSIYYVLLNLVNLHIHIVYLLN